MSGLGVAQLLEELGSVLAELAAVGDRRGSDTLAGKAKELDGKLESQHFVVAVVGEFKRGKSTFINALLGADVLPVGAIPITSVVTLATYGPVPRVEVTFADGTSAEEELAALARYVTERENPGNRLQVATVEVVHPAAPLAEGVRLVDTPGVGSINQHNTETTRDFLAQVDAAVFVTSADQPVSQAERDFLGEVSDNAAHMFFVLNKTDMLLSEEVEEVVEFTVRALTEAIGREVVVYPISALGALAAKKLGDTTALEASGLSRFERDFAAFLVEEKASVLARSVATSAERLIADEANAVHIELETMRLPVEEMTTLAASLERLAESAAISRRELEALLEMETRRQVEIVESDLDDLRPVETNRLLTEASAFLATHPDPRNAAADLDQFVQASLRRSIDTWREREEIKIKELFVSATRRFTEQTTDLVGRTVRLCSALFDVELASPRVDDPFEVDSQFSFAFFDPPDQIQMAVEAIRRKVTGSLARKLLQRRLENDIPVLVDKHCGRLRWDFSQRLDRIRRRLNEDLANRLDSTLDSLRRGMEHARSRHGESQVELDRAAAQLEHELFQLGKLAETLSQIADTGA